MWVSRCWSATPDLTVERSLTKEKDGMIFPRSLSTAASIIIAEVSKRSSPLISWTSHWWAINVSLITAIGMAPRKPKSNSTVHKQIKPGVAYDPKALGTADLRAIKPPTKDPCLLALARSAGLEKGQDKDKNPCKDSGGGIKVQKGGEKTVLVVASPKQKKDDNGPNVGEKIAAYRTLFKSFFGWDEKREKEDAWPEIR